MQLTYNIVDKDIEPMMSQQEYGEPIETYVRLALMNVSSTPNKNYLSFYVCPDLNGDDPHILFPIGSQLIVDPSQNPITGNYVVVTRNPHLTSVFRWSEDPESPLVKLINAGCSPVKIRAYYSAQGLIGVVTKQLFSTTCS